MKKHAWSIFIICVILLVPACSSSMKNEGEKINIEDLPSKQELGAETPQTALNITVKNTGSGSTGPLTGRIVVGNAVLVREDIGRLSPSESNTLLAGEDIMRWAFSDSKKTSCDNRDSFDLTVSVQVRPNNSEKDWEGRKQKYEYQCDQGSGISLKINTCQTESPLTCQNPELHKPEQGSISFTLRNVFRKNITVSQLNLSNYQKGYSVPCTQNFTIASKQELNVTCNNVNKLVADNLESRNQYNFDLDIKKYTTDIGPAYASNLNGQIRVVSE